MPMTGASMFWLDTLRDCNLNQSLPLPYDRYRLSNEHRTGRGTSVSFNFGQDLSRYFLAYALSNKIEPQHLALAIYYVFLFKLTNGESDLCVGMNTHGRYKNEFRSVIGMFVNAIPMRCQLDPHWSFHQLLEHVRETAANILQYSYFPLQRILVQHPDASNPTFLDTSFEFISYMAKNDKEEIMIGDSRLSSIPITIEISEDEIMSKFDFILSIQHDLNNNDFSYTINASLDLFNVETVDKIAQRFHSMLQQLFTSTDSQTPKPIYEISLTMPNERFLIQSVNNTQVLFPSTSCIHHEFVCQVMKCPQKLAVELDDQSVTYCELLHCVGLLSLNLMKKYHVVPGEIVCQCVERSLSMVR
jgi:non-ribosomal peptide synthetase component F